MMKEERKALHKHVISGKLKSIAWGMSANFPYILNQLPHSVELIIDRNQKIWGRSYCGIPISGPQSLVNFDPESTLVIIAASHEFIPEITEHIREFGSFSIIDAHCYETLKDLYCELRGDKSTDEIPFNPFAMGKGIEPVALLQKNLSQLCSSVREVRSIPGHICLSVSRIATGGAERQLVYLACGLRELGWRVTILCYSAPGPAAESYLQMLDDYGVEHIVLPTERAFWGDFDEESVRFAQPYLELVPSFGLSTQHHFLTLCKFFKDNLPDVIVSYMDSTNIVSSIAGIISGCPNIMLSLRSLNPEEQKKIPSITFDFRDMARLYSYLICFDNVHIYANSNAGAASYANWIGCPKSAISVVPNVIDPNSRTVDKRKSRISVFEEFGIPKDAKLLIGVLRFTEEKGPLLFVSISDILCNEIPDLYVLLVGDGPMREEVEEARGRIRQPERLILAGRRSDPFRLMAASNLLLQTSRLEGMPNVVLEAQAVGIPVVATAVGGTRDCLAPVLQPFAAEGQDTQMLVTNCLRFLQDQALAEQVGQKAAQFAQQRTDLTVLAQQTLAVAGIGQIQEQLI